MRIILKEDVEHVGQMGEIVDVKPGYARNYLIPKELAYHANESAINRIKFERKKYEKQQEDRKKSAEEFAKKLGELQVSIPMKVGEEGKLFGSVTPQAVAKQLELMGYDIDRKDIIIDEPIKSLGIFTVKVKLHKDVYAPLKIWVISEE